MPTQRKFTWVDLYVARFLALVWFGAAVAALVLAIRYRQKYALLVMLFALWYSLVWSKVARVRRQLTWHEALLPWRDDKAGPPPS